MKRRTFLWTAIGLTSCQRVLAQPTTTTRRVGVLIGGANNPENLAELEGLRQGLREHGWIEGDNLELDQQWGGGQISAIRASAEVILRGKPEVIAVSTATALREVQKVGGRISLVFWGVSSPVENGFLRDLARPEGNTTGFSLFDYEIGGKWLTLLREIAPRIRGVLLLMNSSNPNWPGWQREMDKVAPTMGIEVVKPAITEESHIVPAVTEFAARSQGGIVVLPDPFLTTPARAELITVIATKLRLPSIYGIAGYARLGGLIAYGPNQVALARSAAGYVSRVLRGEKPSQLPVQRPTRYDLVINARTAGLLGLTLPRSLILGADEVIQ